jgi:hypothetical protein
MYPANSKHEIYREESKGQVNSTCPFCVLDEIN